MSQMPEASLLQDGPRFLRRAADLLERLSSSGATDAEINMLIDVAAARRDALTHAREWAVSRTQPDLRERLKRKHGLVVRRVENPFDVTNCNFDNNYVKGEHFLTITDGSVLCYQLRSDHAQNPSLFLLCIRIRNLNPETNTGDFYWDLYSKDGKLLSSHWERSAVAMAEAVCGIVKVYWTTD